MCSGLTEPSDTDGRSRIAVTASAFKSSSTVLSSSAAQLQPSSVRRKSSLSRLPAPGIYMAGRTNIQTKLPSDGPGDVSVKSTLQPVTAKLASAAANAAAADKRKTVTAIRSLSVRNSTIKSGPLKAMPPGVTPTETDHVDGVFKLP